MTSVIITSIPPGEAPQEVRAAWVGLRLKVAHDQGEQPAEYRVLGIRSNLKGWRWSLSKLLRLASAREETWLGYAIEFLPALWALEQAGRTEAGIWWCKNTPHLLQPGQTVIFPSTCCTWSQSDV